MVFGKRNQFLSQLPAGRFPLFSLVYDVESIKSSKCDFNDFIWTLATTFDYGERECDGRFIAHADWYWVFLFKSLDFGSVSKQPRDRLDIP